MTPMLPLYSDRDPRRLLPKACAIAKGELAALLAVPLIRKPSAARWLSSALAGIPASGSAELFAVAAFTSVLWKALCLLVEAGCAGAATACISFRGSIFRFHSEAWESGAT